MKVKVSNPMVKALKESFPEMNISLQKLGIDAYKMEVDYDVLYHENDFDFSKNCFKVIRIAYPTEFYAIDRYLTTNDLITAFRHSDGTLSGFMDAVREAIEI